MKAAKYTFEDAKTIDLGTKVIHKYPTPTARFDVARMDVDGRHPKGESTFAFETDCDFVIYVLSGSGKVHAGKQLFDVGPGDVVFVPARTNFAVEGKLTYVTFDSPAFYLEQSTQVTK